MHIALIVVSLFFSKAVIAGPWEDRRSKLEHAAVYDEFRIFYSLTGSDSLPASRKIDVNGNGVPDFVEEVGRRLQNMDRFLGKDVVLMSPLESPRYLGKAHYIDVNILNFSLNRFSLNHFSLNQGGPKNGVAYDGTPRFDRKISGQVASSVLAIDLSGSVELSTNTVEHELFHLYQNGYTFFKNRWYTEGTARWSELVVLNRIGDASPLPDSTLTRDRVFQQTYAASTFWNALILILDKEALGKQFIKAVLEELDISDNIAAKDRGLGNSHWKEAEQHSKANDMYIWQAMKNVVRRMSTSITRDENLDKLLGI